MSCGGFQGLGSLGAGDTGFQHDEGDGDVVAGGFQGIVSLLAINIGGVLEDGDSALGKLAVLQTQIDHEVAIDVSETGHGTSGNHVQNHLLGGAGFHAARACQDFGADVGDDGEMGSTFELGVGIAGEGDGLRATTTGVLDGRNCEGSASAGGNADHDIFLCRLALDHFGAAQFAGILTGFGFGPKSFGPAGNDVLHEAGRSREGGRNFGSVEGADAPAGAGADVEQSSALAEMGGHEVDGAGNLRQRVLDRCGDFGVFGIDDAGNLEGGFEVDVVGLGIGTFGGQVLQAAWLHSEFENNIVRYERGRPMAQCRPLKGTRKFASG